MKSEKIITKAMVLAICVLFLAAMSAVCIASNAAYSVPIGTGAADLADNNLASATGYTASVAGWSEDIRLTSDSATSYDPTIAVDTNNNVHITWYDYIDEFQFNYEIYYTKLDNNGNTLVDDTRLTPADSATSYDPTIAVDTNNNVHITWNDGRDRNWEIYYTKLDNNGNTLVDDTRLTSDSAESRDPAIAVDTNNNVHITWENERDGNHEIYYKHTITPTPAEDGLIEDTIEIGGKIYCLVKGDLLFYESALDHIGMYSSDGKFIDAHLNNSPGVKKEQEIKGSRFDKPATQCYRVKTTQAKRNDAVEWAEEKHGKDFSLFPPAPCCDADDECADDKWYCSELVHCAYKAQSITLGRIAGEWIHPESIISDSDVKQVSSKAIVESATPTPEEKGAPGFESVFAIAGLLAVAYLLRRRK